MPKEAARGTTTAVWCPTALFNAAAAAAVKVQLRNGFIVTRAATRFRNQCPHVFCCDVASMTSVQQERLDARVRELIAGRVFSQVVKVVLGSYNPAIAIFRSVLR